MNYIIPKELQINLDNHQNNVLEKDKLIGMIETYKNIKFLEFYVNAINMAVKKNPIYNINDVKEIISACNKKINRLKGIDEVVETFKEVKKNTTKFDNVSIACSPKEINDKTLENTRKDVYYIKININGKNELYEISNVDKIMNIINNTELINDMSEKELINKLTSKEVSIKLDTNNLDMRNNQAITPDYIKEEINNIYDSRVRNTFECRIDEVIKERLDLNEYVKKTMPEAKIEYALNSNGERIYMVKDKIIKFEGIERNMYFLSENGDKINNTNSFEQHQTGTHTDEDTLKEYKDMPELLRSQLYLLFEGTGLTNEQKENVIKFLNICINNEEKGISNENLQEIFDEYYIYAKENNSYPDDRIRIIFNRKEDLEKKLGTEEKNLELENNPKELKLIKKDMTDLNSRAFITTAIILESTLVLAFIISLVLLIK